MEELLNGYLLRVEHEGCHVIVISSVVHKLSITRTEEITCLINKGLVTLDNNQTPHDIHLLSA